MVTKSQNLVNVVCERPLIEGVVPFSAEEKKAILGNLETNCYKEKGNVFDVELSSETFKEKEVHLTTWMQWQSV